MNLQPPKIPQTECALLRPAQPYTDARTDARETVDRLTPQDRAAIARYYDSRWPRVKTARLHGRMRTRKRWTIGGHLPAGLRTMPLPRELEQMLTPLEPGYQRLLAGSEIVCIETATSIIVDVMRGGQRQHDDTPQLLRESPQSRPQAAQA